MLSEFTRKIIVVLAMLMFLVPVDSWAGKGNYEGNRPGFFNRIGMSIKKTGAKIADAVMDTGVNIKEKITGRKPKTWVHGHYREDGVWVKGHWRVVDQSQGGKGGSVGGDPIASVGDPGQGNHPGQGDGKDGGQKIGFFRRIGRGIRKGGAAIVNRIMDTYVNLRYRVAGRKERVWVRGHYQEDGTWVKGHWRYMPRSAGGKGGDPGQGGADQGHPGQGGGVDSAPPSDPVVPDPLPDPFPDLLPEPPSGLASYDEEPAASDEAAEDSESTESWGSSFDAVDISDTVNFLLAASTDLDEMKADVVRNKKNDLSGELMTSMQSDYESVLQDRDDLSQLLFHTIVQDLENNKGAPGPKYNQFLSRVSSMSKQDRAKIRDVIQSLKDNALHNVNNDEKSLYRSRYRELDRL